MSAQDTFNIGVQGAVKDQLRSRAAPANAGIGQDAEGYFPRWATKKTRIRSDQETARSLARYVKTKRIFDILLLLVVSPFLVPILAVVSLLVKLEDGGPVFYRQRRYGRNGQPFEMLKFRTMVTNSEELIPELAHLNEVEWPEFLITNDPRVTRIGGILRRTSLDELPQLLNVATGEMSLIGPRASSVPPGSYKKAFLSRLDVVPGIAGPGHIWRRSDVFDKKCELDVAYVKYRSTLLDMYLIVQTVVAAVSSPKGN
jgi:lipopolysaccharide/colanic/teichoic acid biosynthesis glycosyltransferase